MRVRAFRMEDEPILREIHERAGYGDEFPDVSDFLVVTDDLDCPIMAAGEKLIPELTLICAPGGSTHALVKLQGIHLLHEALRDRLVAKGYTEAIASVPPKLEGSYARHLQRHFGWVKSWETFRIRDWRRS